MNASDRRLLVGFDESDPARTALALAGKLAAAGGSLHVIHSYWVPPEFHLYEFFADLEEAYAEVGQEALEQARAVIGDTSLPISYDAIEGKAAEVLCDSAAKMHADLLLVGSRGHGRLALGSVSSRVLANAPCPVVVVPPEAAVPSGRWPLRVLVAIDGSKHSDRALDEALSVVHRDGGQIALISVAPEPVDLYIGAPELPKEVVNLTREIEAEQRRLLERAADRCRDAGVACNQKLLSGSAGPRIIDELTSSSYDLVALGSRGRSRVKALVLGSVSHSVTQKSPVPVLVCRAG